MSLPNPDRARSQEGRPWRVVAVADALMPERFIRAGLAETPCLSDDLTVVEWCHDDVSGLQRDNLLIEMDGPSAVDLPAEVVAAVEGAEVLLTQFCPVSAQLIDGSPDLRAIGVLRGGLENVDLSAARGAGIDVVSTPGRNANAVAEFTVGLILASTRGIGASLLASHLGEWSPAQPGGTGVHEVRGLTVGLIGAGRVGGRVIELLAPFGCRVLFHDPEVRELKGATWVESLDELLRFSDVVSVHARLVKDGAPLLDAAAIANLKRNAIVVNTARSGLIDTDALVEALQEQRIAGAALDTFDAEPLPVDSPLRHLPNLIATHHLAGSTEEAFAGSVPLLAARLMGTIGAPERSPR